ncbi:MAG TPA: efflux RND transporter periplasmic adaptor subunit [Candidatus Binataceae bacterium]|nr:efflux RND transporter periplasmic adaptor subunit [Candidatus Binataceae bacterium]
MASVPVMAVSAARVTRAPIQQSTRLLGLTQALRHVTLRAPCAGMVQGLELQSGDRVRRGQIVAQVINQEDLAAQAGLGVARKLDPASAAQLARTIKRFASDAGVPVVVPQAAVVAKRLVSNGQIVAYLDPLVDLIDPSSIYVQATVPIDQARRLKPGMMAEISSPLAPGEVFPARLQALAPSFDLNPATASARLAFLRSPPLAVAGIAVEVTIVTETVSQAVVIPKAALFESAGTRSYYVFVDQNQIARRTTIVPGVRQDDLVEVRSGLRPGQIVITSGGYALSDGLKVRATIEPDNGAASKLMAPAAQTGARRPVAKPGDQ